MRAVTWRATAAAHDVRTVAEAGTMVPVGGPMVVHYRTAPFGAEMGKETAYPAMAGPISNSWVPRIQRLTPKTKNSI